MYVTLAVALAVRLVVKIVGEELHRAWERVRHHLQRVDAGDQVVEACDAAAVGCPRLGDAVGRAQANIDVEDAAHPVVAPSSSTATSMSDGGTTNTTPCVVSLKTRPSVSEANQVTWLVVVVVSARV